MSTYIKREILHTLFAVGVTVLVAVAADLANLGSFEEVSLAGLAVTAVRSGATAVVTLLSRFVVE